MQRYGEPYEEHEIKVLIGTKNNLTPEQLAEIVDNALSFYLEEGYYRVNGQKIDFTLEVTPAT